MAPRQSVKHVHVSTNPPSPELTEDYDVLMGVKVNCPSCDRTVHIPTIKVGMVKDQTFYAAKIEGSNSCGPNVPSMGHCSTCGTVVQLTWKSFQQAVKRAQREGRWYKFFSENPPTERQLAAIQKI